MKKLIKLLTLVMMLCCSWSGALYANDLTLQTPAAGEYRLFAAAFVVLALIMIFLIAMIIVGFKRSQRQLIEAQNDRKKENQT